MVDGTVRAKVGGDVKFSTMSLHSGSQVPDSEHDSTNVLHCDKLAKVRVSLLNWPLDDRSTVV